MHVDSLITTRWLVPVEPAGKVLEHHAVAVESGRIAAILPTHQAREQIRAEHEVDCTRHLVLPGLVNAHTHSPMTLFRGLADDLPLMTWLNDHIWPAEHRWVHEDFVADGSRLAMTEMLRGGTTCFQDMYFFPDVTARVASQVGMRAVVGLIVIDFPSAWAESVDDYFAKGIALHDHLRGHPLVRTAFAAHSPYAVSDEPLARVRKLADELDLPVHIHVHETADEVQGSLARYGSRPLARLDRLGLVSPSLAAVHMTQLEPEEIDRMAQSGGHVIHCPESNLKLASGFCPVAKLLDAGVNVALGTDGAASNNDLDMIGEMRTAALLAKGVAADPKALPAFEVLKMATLGGAKALGLDGEIGSLVPGKAADIVAVDLGAPETTPVYNPVSQLVYAAARNQVTDVWVAGAHLLRRGQLTSIDLAEVQSAAAQWAGRIGAQD